jgi:hypothetical protein
MAVGRKAADSSTMKDDGSGAPVYQWPIRLPHLTPLKCQRIRSNKGERLITYQNLVSQDYAQKSGKSRTIANKFGMY